MKTNKVVSIGSIAVVIGAIVVGLYLSGSPKEQRLLRLDERRVSDLINISHKISSYRRVREVMPDALTALVDGHVSRRLPVDPVTEASYLFEIVEGDNYKLCAEFSRVSKKHQAGDFWHHGAGLHCFELSAAAR